MLVRMGFKFFFVAVFAGYAVLLLGMLSYRRFRRKPSREVLASRASQANRATDQPLVEVINVKKSFDHPVLRGVSLQVHRGETIGVLGKSGTGKSVLLKLIAGFLRPDSGMILYKGRETSQLDEDELLEFRKQVSYVFQGGAFFDFLNVWENVAYPLREQGVSDEDLIRERVEYLLDAVELERLGEMRYDELSAGAKKQVAIARAIANNPEVILYDEPTTGVDPIIGKALSRLIKKLDQHETLTSIVVTHDLKCLEIVSDRLILLHSGLVHFSGTVEEFYESTDPFVRAFREGTRFTEASSPLPAA